ncbi:MAG TPA: polysaccharide deacetylase family protein [Peptococcaceae bacterium]|nr:polysaccharide deacetylase family protein [Peptococcaceae bacterium]
MITKNVTTKNIITFLLSVLILLGLLTVIVFGIIFANMNKDLPSLSGSEDYNVAEKIKIALDNLQKGTMAEIIAKVNTSEKVIVLTFQGLSDADTNQRVLDLITKYNRKVNFFVPGVSAAENANFVKELSSRGHRVGSNTLYQTKNMQDYSQEELIYDFVRANSIIQSITNKKPITLMCNSTIYSEDLLKAAFASGNTRVVQATKFLNYQSFKDYEQVVNYLRNLDKGSIISIKMDGVLEEDEYGKSGEPANAEPKPAGSAQPALDKQPMTVDQGQTIAEIKPEGRLIIIVDWLFKALGELDYQVVFAEDLDFYKNLGLPSEQEKPEPVKPEPAKPNGNNAVADDITYKELAELRKANQGKKAQEYRTIYTTEKALSYTFYGIDNKEVLDGVLTNLDRLKVKGTFFVTKENVIHYPELVRKIAQKGHELGICLSVSRDKDFYSTLRTLLFVQKSVAQLTNQTPTLVRYPYDIKLKDEILEAISSVNGKIIWQDLSVASSKVGVKGTLAQIMDNIFGEGNLTVRRGYIIYFRMDYYQDPRVIPAALIKIAQDRIDPIAYKDEVVNNGSSYSIKTVGAVLNGKKTYNYPLSDDVILPAVKNRIYPGHLAGYSELDKFSLIYKKYIGNPYVSNLNTLPGFTEQELEEIDKTGRFTQDKVLFLTFDDWASDKSINQILYVLEKHDVPGNFFIRTGYMQNNPNILRAIAEAGHDVGSHTDNHLPFAIGDNYGQEDDLTSIYRSPTEEELRARREDLLISYNKLLRVIGDIAFNNRPVLNTLLRPPTLAMSRAGMEAIFDMGFSHIVSGDFNSHDYEDTDAGSLVNKIINGMVMGNGNIKKVQNGSILIMHMSDFRNLPVHSSNNITAEALDRAIPILKANGYRFAKLSDYLETVEEN